MPEAALMESTPVADMLCLPYAGCGGERTIAYRDGQPVSVRDFHARIGAWRNLLADRAGRRFALFLEDSLDFGAALYGAWLAGKTVYLPGDTLAATCAALGMTVDGFLGDFDGAWSPLSPSLPVLRNLPRPPLRSPCPRPTSGYPPISRR